MRRNLISDNSEYYDRHLLRDFLIKLSHDYFYIESFIVTWTSVPDRLKEEFGILCTHAGGGRFEIQHNPLKEAILEEQRSKKTIFVFDENEIVG